MSTARISSIAKWLMTVIGIGAVFYHLIMVQWQIQGSTFHYITHLFLAIVIASLASIPEALVDLS